MDSAIGQMAWHLNQTKHRSNQALGLVFVPWGSTNKSHLRKVDANQLVHLPARPEKRYCLIFEPQTIGQSGWLFLFHRPTVPMNQCRFPQIHLLFSRWAAGFPNTEISTNSSPLNSPTSCRNDPFQWTQASIQSFCLKRLIYLWQPSF